MTRPHAPQRTGSHRGAGERNPHNCPARGALSRFGGVKSRALNAAWSQMVDEFGLTAFGIVLGAIISLAIGCAIGFCGPG